MIDYPDTCVIGRSAGEVDEQGFEVSDRKSTRLNSSHL